MKGKFGLVKETGSLSVGICDTCTELYMECIGDHQGKPYEEMVCHKKSIIIEPCNEEEQVKECEFYKKDTRWEE